MPEWHTPVNITGLKIFFPAILAEALKIFVSVSSLV